MKLKSYTAAPLLAVLVYLLTIFSDRLIASLDLSANAALLVSGAIQIGAYIIPLFIYALLFGGFSVSRMRLRAPSATSVPSLLLLTVILLIGSMLLSLVSERLGFSKADSAVNTVSANGWIVLLVFALIPALCEEIVFRGMILSAFESCGVAPAIIGTSLLFAFAHMSLEKLPVYFFSSVVLCFSVYVSRSLFSAIVIHFIYNAVSVYVSDYISGIAAHLESFALLFIVMLFALWIIVLFTMTETSRVYRVYSEKGLDSGYAPRKMTRAQRIKGGASVYFSLPFLMCALIYIAVVILSLR